MRARLFFFLILFFSSIALPADLCGVAPSEQREILHTVSLFRVWRLEEETKIDKSAALALLKYKSGADGLEGTEDDRRVVSFTVLVDLVSCFNAKLIGIYTSNQKPTGAVGSGPLSFMALTYSSRTRNFGVSRGKPTLRSAWNEAIWRCGASDCFGSISTNGCLVLYAPLRWGRGVIASGRTFDQAAVSAAHGCRSLNDHGCHYLASVCEN